MATTTSPFGAKRVCNDDSILFPGHVTVLGRSPSRASMGDTRQVNFVFRPRSEQEWLSMFS